MNDRPHLTISESTRAREGSCNFCTRKDVETVYCVKSRDRPSPLVVTICVKCLWELQRYNTLKKKRVGPQGERLKG